MDDRGPLAWALLAGVLALAILWGTAWGWFVKRRTDPYNSGVIAVGQPWDDGNGAKFTVLEARRLTAIDPGYDKPRQAPEGSSFLLVKLGVSGFNKDTSCFFDLLGQDGERWQQRHEGLPAKTEEDKKTYTRCPTDEDIKPEVTYWLHWLVPDDRIAGLKGLYRHSMVWNHPPALAIPRT